MYGYSGKYPFFAGADNESEDHVGCACSTIGSCEGSFEVLQLSLKFHSSSNKGKTGGPENSAIFFCPTIYQFRVEEVVL